MRTFTEDGRQKVKDIAARYNLRPETVEHLLDAIIRGNGTMAQFNLPELGGHGQWMKGGMTMVGDMFNNSLRATVDKLCNELAELVTTTIVFKESENGTSLNADGYTDASDRKIFSRSNSSWPAIFGTPTATGSQNTFSYAYFAPVRRLVIEEDGKRTIYDTKHHQITGVSQQQGATNSYHFTSPGGPVNLGSLEIVSDPDRPNQPTPEILYDVTSTSNLQPRDKTPQDIVISTIESLNILFEKGQITEEELTAKKKELLERL